MQFEDIIKLPWRDMLSILLKDGPKDCTWYAVRGYVESTYTQEQIIQVNVALWKRLDSMDDIEIDGEEADDIRDVSDIWWYAMDDTEKFHEALKPFLKKE